MERNRTQLRGAALLMLTALIWGTAFVAQSVGMDHLGPCAFTAVRNYIGCVALLPVIAFASRLRKHLHHDDTDTELEVAIEDPKYEDNTDTLLEADPE